MRIPYSQHEMNAKSRSVIDLFFIIVFFSRRIPNADQSTGQACFGAMGGIDRSDFQKK